MTQLFHAEDRARYGRESDGMHMASTRHEAPVSSSQHVMSIACSGEAPHAAVALSLTWCSSKLGAQLSAMAALTPARLAERVIGLAIFAKVQQLLAEADSAEQQAEEA